MTLRDRFKVYYQKRRPYLRFYARRSLEDAAWSAAAGFLASLATGLTMGCSLQVSLIVAVLTALASFTREFKGGNRYEQRW